MEQFSISFDEVKREESRPESHVLTVSELTAQVKQLMDRTFFDVWVVGEVSNFRNQTRRHYYFTLKDDQSQLNAVMFNGPARVDEPDDIRVPLRAQYYQSAMRMSNGPACIPPDRVLAPSPPPCEFVA